jgi:hypothetical protein
MPGDIPFEIVLLEQYAFIELYRYQLVLYEHIKVTDTKGLYSWGGGGIRESKISNSLH